jgi:hypothetical protein
MLVGAIKGVEEPFELHYKLPDDKRQVAGRERAVLMLTLRDEVVDSALQRRVILRTEQGTTPFIYVAEGSDTPYRLVVEALNLTVEQLEERGDGHPPA